MINALKADEPVITTVRERYEDLFGAICRAFDFAEIPLTETLIRETIPASVFDYAVISGWIPDVPQVARHKNDTGHRDEFMNLISDPIDFWLFQLDHDKEALWNMRAEQVRPRFPDPSSDTPATLLQDYRHRNGSSNWVELAERAAKLSRSHDFEAIKSAIYRICKGCNVNKATLVAVAAALSTPGRQIDWKELRWPKTLGRRIRSESANNK